MMKFSPWTCTFAICLLLTASPVSADQVIMANGDRISGNIIYVSPTEIQLETEYAGTICIDFWLIQDLYTDRSGRLLLQNGDVITGAIESIHDDYLSITSESLGDVKVPLDLFLGFQRLDVAQPIPPPGDFAPRLDTQAEHMSEADSGQWTGSLALGTQLQRGNTERATVHFETIAVRKLPREELRFKLFANYGETEGHADQNRIYGEAKMKVFPDTRWYLFGVTNLEYDEIKNLDLRAQLFGGPGYNFIQTENTSLLGEIGAGVTSEFFDENGETDTLEPSIWLNSEWKQKLFERVALFQGLTFYPQLDDFGDYRFRSTTSLTTPIGDHWSVKLSAIDEYDSDPQGADVKKNDLRFFSALEYKF